jgi:hypothetical protein
MNRYKLDAYVRAMNLRYLHTRWGDGYFWYDKVSDKNRLPKNNTSQLYRMLRKQ